MWAEARVCGQSRSSASAPISAKGDGEMPMKPLKKHARTIGQALRT